jgi:hypothetical protein
MRKTRTVVVATTITAVLATPAAAGAATASSPPTRSTATVAPAGATTSSAVAATARPHSHRLPGTSCRIFPADNYWHADVRRLPVNSRSAQWLSRMDTAGRYLHPDFGPSYGEQPVPYGIPVTVVTSGPKVPVRFHYASESDRVRYPLSRTTRIEGGWDAGGDRHAVVVDARTCTLYETYDTRLTGSGWTAGSGAVWKLRSNRLRHKGWTSADAAGLPILPGLLRYDEVERGRVDHAIRFTTDVTDRRFVWPARHQAGSVSDRSYPPMGARFRLKKSFSTKGFSRDAKVVLKAMKRYGLVLADNGSPWYFQGTADTRWKGKLISALKRIPASAFEAVDTSALRVRSGSGRVR